MKRFKHSRGNSQQIPKCKNKPLPDFKHNYAFSSEHTRSTLTLCRSKDKNKDRNKMKSKDNNKQTDKKKKNKYGGQEWKADQVPYTPNQVLRLYAHLLDESELGEIKEYQNIYYIGTNRVQEPEELSQSLIQQQIQSECRIGDHIAYRYEIVSSIGRGSFGQVLKVYDHKTKQFSALKIVKKSAQLLKQSFIQISILTAIKDKDKDSVSGIVRLKDYTMFRQHICIIMELMDSNLYQLLNANDFKGLNEEYVRRLAIQMLNSLNFLNKMGVIHCDIKPENFVLRAWGKSGIKLIDFGTSCYQTQQIYTYIQSRYYRAPQIIFQNKYSTSIDMWSLGCLLVELMTGRPLFPGNSDLQQLTYMCNLLGFPQANFANKCKQEIQFIKKNKYLERDQFGKLTSQAVQRLEREIGLNIQFGALLPLEQKFSEDMFSFVHLLKQILKWDPEDRITPAEALQHPWVAQGLPNQVKQLHTIYESIDKTIPKQAETITLIKKAKRVKSKSKSKSKGKQRSEDKNSSITKASILNARNSLTLNFKNDSKVLKFDLAETLMPTKSKMCKKKRSQQKSRNEKSNKSPSASRKFYV